MDSWLAPLSLRKGKKEIICNYWRRNKDLIKTVATVEVVSLVLSSSQGTEKAAEGTDAFSGLHFLGSVSSTRPSPSMLTFA